MLVVEDSPDMNRFIANCLSSEGFDVTEAFDGVQGYEKATADHPDLVVTDIVMPRMSGDELIRRLRQRPDFRSTPILVLGAKSDDELRLRLQRDDVQDYLDKPFSVDELRARARTLVARKRAADQADQRASARRRGRRPQRDLESRRQPARRERADGFPDHRPRGAEPDRRHLRRGGDRQRGRASIRRLGCHRPECRRDGGGRTPSRSRGAARARGDRRQDDPRPC